MNGEVIVQNLIPHLQAWWPVIRVVGGMIGFCLVLAGIYTFTAKNGGGHSTKGKGVAEIMGGTVLLNVISLLDVFSQSIFAKASETGLSYSAPGGDDPMSLYITFAIYIVMLVGFCGVIYGGMMLAKGDSNQHGLPKVFTHIVGGTLAINIVKLLHVLGSSMGPSVESAVNKIVG